MNLTINIIDQNFSSLNVDSISIGGSVVNNTNSQTESVADGTEVEVIIANSNYLTYTQSFKVYTEDLSLTILMAPIVTDISSPNYLRPYPYLSLIKDPCSFNVDYYSTSNSLGNTEWYFNNEKINEAQKGTVDTCSPGYYQIKIRQTTSDNSNGFPSIVWDRQYATSPTGNFVYGELLPIETYLEFDTITNVVVVEHKPDVSFNIEGSKQDDCYNRDSEVTITPDVNLNIPESGNETITWEVTNPNDEVILETVTDLTTPITILLDELGIYKVNAKVNDDCGIYEYDLQINTCNFLVITQTGCSDFLLQNKGENDLTFEIQDMTGEEVLSSTSLEAMTETVISFDQVGFYQVLVTGQQEEIYFINNYCEIEDCFSAYIESILCQPMERCNPCPDETELNQMFLFQYTYFGKLHKEFTFNNFYTGLDQSKLDQITTIEQLAEKILTFCERRGCIQSDTFRPAGEETYDWAGKGDNREKTCSCSPSQQLNYYQTGPSYTGCKSCGS